MIRGLSLCSYSVALRPAADGPVRITLLDNKFKDLADNLNTRADDDVIQDLTPPVITLLIRHPPIGNLTAARFLVRVSEDLAQVNTSSVTVQNGNATALLLLNTTEGAWPGQVRPPSTHTHLRWACTAHAHLLTEAATHKRPPAHMYASLGKHGGASSVQWRHSGPHDVTWLLVDHGAAEAP